MGVDEMVEILIGILAILIPAHKTGIMFGHTEQEGAVHLGI